MNLQQIRKASINEGEHRMNLQQIRKASINLDQFSSKAFHHFEVGKIPTKTVEVEAHWDGFEGRLIRKMMTEKVDMPVVTAIPAYDTRKGEGRVAVRFADGTGRWFKGRQLSITGREEQPDGEE